MPDQPKQEQVTEYVVLRQEPAPSGPQPVWEVLAAGVKAVNAQAAIKQATDGAGTYVAVPARSWKPVTRRVETVTKDVWS